MSYRGDCEANGAPIWTPPCLGGCAISVYPTSRGEAGSWKPLKLDLGEGVSRGWPPFAKRCLNSSAAGERFIATSGLGSPATDGVRNATNAHRDNFEMDSRSETEHAKIGLRACVKSYIWDRTGVHLAHLDTAVDAPRARRTGRIHALTPTRIYHVSGSMPAAVRRSRRKTLSASSMFSRETSGP